MFSKKCWSPTLPFISALEAVEEPPFESIDAVKSCATEDDLTCHKDGHVFWPQDGACYELLSQGPCQHNSQGGGNIVLHRTSQCFNFTPTEGMFFAGHKKKYCIKLTAYYDVYSRKQAIRCFWLTVLFCCGYHTKTTFYLCTMFISELLSWQYGSYQIVNIS